MFVLYQEAFFANLNMVVRIAGFLSCQKNDVWANEKAEFEQNKFYYITKGRCVIKIHDKEYYGEEGSWFYIPPNTKHGYYNIKDEPFEKFWFHFDLYPNGDIFKSLNLDYCMNVKDENILHLFSELVSKYNSGKLTDKLDIKSLAINILSAYIKNAGKETSVPTQNDEEKISRVLAYINENIKRHISNVELSELCYMHPNHFVRYFKKKTGTTPQKYIMRTRVDMAKRLIEQTDMTFADIATQVGLCDASHLSKLFKSFYSLNPYEYRKMRDNH